MGGADYGRPNRAYDTFHFRPGGMLLALWLHHGFVRLLLRRAAATLFLCVGITFIAFVLTHLVPGDPVAATLGLKAYSDPGIVKAYKAAYGLDKPLPVQYEVYLSHLLHGDLGRSLLTHQAVATDLSTRIPASLELGILAMSIAAAIGLPLGVLAAVRRGSRLDQALTIASLGGIATPSFWIGLIALYVFSFVLQIAPSTGRLSPGLLPPPHVTGMYTIDSLLVGDPATFVDALHHLILPALVLATTNVAVLLRFTRSAVLEVINNDYVTAARAKGLPRAMVIQRYALRGALTPILTVSGLLLANLMTGAVLVESIFAWPGVGLYAAQSALHLDLAAITGVCIFVAVVYAGTNFVVDVLHAWIDPRVVLG
jgi:peptide/nickel transport system permease protein